AVRKTRPPLTTGLDWFWSCWALSSWPGSGTFQRTLSPSLPPHRRGRPLSVLTPCPVGPRQQGQSPAGDRPAPGNRAQAPSTTISLLIVPPSPVHIRSLALHSSRITLVAVAPTRLTPRSR